MKKTRVFSILIVAVMLIVSLAACGQKGGTTTAAPATQAAGGETTAASATEEVSKPITLSYSMAMPTSHKYVGFDEEWIANTSELSGGTITIEPHWAASLVPPTSSYAECTAGVCDIIQQVPGNEVEHFIVDNAIQYFYYGSTDAESLYQVTSELWEMTPEWQAEYDGTQKLTFGTSGTAYLLSRKEIKSLDDLKGMTIRGQCDVNYSLIDYFGASAVKMPLGTVYESLSSGTIDAVLIPVDAYETLNLADICPYIYYFGFSEPWYVHKFINNDAWGKLSGSQKEALVKASGLREEIELENVLVTEASAIKYAADNGIEVRYLSDADYEKINKAFEEIALIKVEELNAQGYDGQTIFDNARSLMDKIVK